LKTTTKKTAKTAQKEILSLAPESYIKVGKTKTRKIMMLWHKHHCNAFFAFNNPMLFF